MVSTLDNTSDRKIIFNLSFPAVMQTVMRSMFIIIDAYWVGKLGSQPLAALTVATFIVWGVIALGEVIATGTNSLVAQASGAKSLELARNISTENIVNSLVYTFIVGVCTVPALPFLYGVINLSPDIAALADEYLKVFLYGLPAILVLSTVTAIFRGYEDTKTPFKLLFVALTLNFFLAPLFIFGINGYFKWGIAGSAVSTMISFFIESAAGYFILLKRKLIYALHKYKFDFAKLKETFRIGFPIALNGVFFSFIYVLISRIVSDYGTVGFAAIGISNRSESLSYQICVGFSLTATILVGQFVGAGDYKKAERLAWKTLLLTINVMVVIAVLLFAFSTPVAEVFSSDYEVIPVASLFNKITSLVLVFSACEVVLSGAFAGAGDSFPPFIIATPLNLARVPFVWLFSHLWGLTGLWAAVCMTVVLKGIIITLWFKKGSWKNKRSKLLDITSSGPF